MTRRVLTAIMVLVSLLAVGGAVGSVGASGGADGGEKAPAGTLAPPQTNNTTSHHDNPETVGQTGDSTKAWLEAEFARKLGESSIQISKGEYERARNLVDNDTKDLLGKYVDVAGRTAEEDDDKTAEKFEDAQENQEEFVNKTQEYEETYREYQEARQNGDEQRARRLARELEQISENATTTGTRLIRNLRNVSQRTGVDLQNAQTAVNETIQNISERQAEVRESTFVETSLQIRTTASSFSFRNPLTISGHLVDENGSALENRTMTLQVGRSVRTVETGPNGSFTLEYRPVVLPMGTEQVTVRYIPKDDSPYLGARRTVQATLKQSTANLNVTVDSDTVRFGDTVHVSGGVNVNGTPVEGLPLVVRLGNHRLGTVRTDSTGQFSLDGRVPSHIPVGDTAVIAQVGDDNLAIEQTRDTTSLRIRETPTDLTLEAEPEGRQIRVNGTLTTADGRPLANRNVRIQVEGLTKTAVETDSAGRYVTTIRVPEEVRGTNRSVVNVTADFSWNGRNLGPSRATTTVLLPGAGGNSGSATDQLRDLLWDHPWIVGGLGTALFVALLGGGLYVMRKRGIVEETDTEEQSEPDGTEALPSARAETMPLLTQARDRLSEDPQSAIRLGYAAVRERFGADEAATHWEFYADISDDVDDDGTLRSLTETYERAVFGHGVAPDEAEDAVESATRITRGDPAHDGGSSPDQ